MSEPWVARASGRSPDGCVALQVAGLIELGRPAGGDASGLELRFLVGAGATADARRFRELMGLAPDRESYPVRMGIGVPDATLVLVKPRSLLGVMAFLSEGVEVPEHDLRAGLVTATTRADGSPFDWRELFDGMFAIRSAAERPAGAAVAVAYRGSWFFVRDDDLDAKSTFSLLSQLVALQSGQTSTPPTLLSFSVGR